MPNKKQRLAFIGLGSMGIGMASRLAELEYPLVVYNRTPVKASQVQGSQVRVATTPSDAAANATIVLLSLSDQPAVTSVLFDPDGVFEGLTPGSYIVDLSTVSPDFARDVARRASAAGFHALDACVLGNPQHSRHGELRVMVGGEDADFQAVTPVLRDLGKEVTHFGPSGMGATMKLVLNLLMGVQMTALAEAIVFGEQAGLPRDKILQTISGSGYSSPVMNFRCGIMARRSFQDAAFKLALMRKDVMLVLSDAQKLGVPMPVSESAYAMLTAARQQGLGDLDISAILAFMERLSGMDTYPWPV